MNPADFEQIRVFTEYIEGSQNSGIKASDAAPQSASPDAGARKKIGAPLSLQKGSHDGS
jgi:hypothetical protein